MPPSLLSSAEWISTARRRATTAVPNGGRGGSSASTGCCPRHTSTSRRSSSRGSTISPHLPCDQGEQGSHDQRREHAEEAEVVGHRGSGGLIRGRAVFCLPPEVEWFQGHFAYTAVGGCSASLGVLGTKLPVDPCMQCCHGGFARHKLVFIHHESGKEATLIVERYGGNMMSLRAEPSVVGGGDGRIPPESELSFETHTMKADDDARVLLDRYFQSIVRAASNPAELQECIVCIGQMDVPLSLLQELAAQLPDSRTHSMVCSAFTPCRETQQQQQWQQPQPWQHGLRRQRQRRLSSTRNTPVLSPYPTGGETVTPSASSSAEPEPEAVKEAQGTAASASCSSSPSSAGKAAATAARRPHCSENFQTLRDYGVGEEEADCSSDETKEDKAIEEVVEEARRLAAEIGSRVDGVGIGGGDIANSEEGCCTSDTREGVASAVEATGPGVPVAAVRDEVGEENDWLE